jgi:ribosomal-protein-alanine N-acetyltransferase
MITLETERLIIREYQESDLPEYHKLLSDKQNMYYLDDIITNSLEESRESLRNTIEINNSGKARRFCITLKDRNDDKLIGGVGYEITTVTPHGKIADPMGWFIMPEFQSKGYITEAAKCVLDFAFSQNECIRVVTGCYKDNMPTQRVMEKVGFRKEGERFEAQYHDGKMKDRLEYALNKDEWEIQKEKAYYKALPVIFDDFIDLPELSDGIIHLVCTSKRQAIPEKKYVPAYDFAICKGSEKVGEINLRIGYCGFGPDESSLYYGGQIGYGVDEKYRGNGYAVRACRLLLPVAKAHGMMKLLITNNVTNTASKRVCEKLSARFIRTVRLPEWTDMFKNGSRFNNVYEWSVE